VRRIDADASGSVRMRACDRLLVADDHSERNRIFDIKADLWSDVYNMLGLEDLSHKELTDVGWGR
jgi:hypothetical protein